MTLGQRSFRTVAVAGWMLFFLLQILAIKEQSLSEDEPFHIIAGYQALRYGCNTLNLEHPPLVKILAAVPLVLSDKPLAPPLQATSFAALEPYAWADPQRFLAAGVLARLVVFGVFGLPMLLLSYRLGREASGDRAGVVLALGLGLSFCVLPFLPLVLTDIAETAAYSGTLLTVLGYLRQPTAKRIAFVGLATGVGLSVKFSGVLLVPSVVCAVLLACGLTLRQRAIHLVAAGAIALATVHASYLIANWNYSHRIGAETISRYCRGEASLNTGDSLRRWERPLLDVERFDPPMAQWLAGLLGVASQNRRGVYLCYAFGQLSTRGFWWYFPLLLLVKLPLSVLACTLTTLAAALRRSRRTPGPPLLEGCDWRAKVTLTVTAVVFGLTSMTSTINVGLRHLFPILPVLLLPVAAMCSRRIGWAIALLLALAIESALLAPAWMAATNTWWLASRNPTRLAFANANLDFNQSFTMLARATRRMGIEQVHVVHPVAPSAHIVAVIPRAKVITFDSPIEPGWYAVSVAFEQYLPAIARANAERVRDLVALTALAEQWRVPYNKIVQGEDHGYVAGTFHLYLVPEAR